MLLKPKQIDLNELAYQLAITISNDVSLLQIWTNMLNNTYFTAVFAPANGNIVIGQTNFVINYAVQPDDVIVHRNGSKQIVDKDFSLSYNTGNFTVTFFDPIGPSQGGVFSEIVEINYY